MISAPGHSYTLAAAALGGFAVLAYPWMCGNFVQQQAILRIMSQQLRGTFPTDQFRACTTCHCCVETLGVGKIAYPCNKVFCVGRHAVRHLEIDFRYATIGSCARQADSRLSDLEVLAELLHV